MSSNEACRDRADEGVVGRVEDGIEASREPAGALRAPEAEEPLFPREPVGVEGAAEVEQYGRSIGARFGTGVRRRRSAGATPPPAPPPVA